MGLIGWNGLYRLIWRDPDAERNFLHFGGDCLPEHINLDAMSVRTGST